MGFGVLLCVLCLQASLLSHAFDCSGASRGEPCVSKRTADGQQDDQRHPRAFPSSESLVLFRRRRQVDRRVTAHLSHLSQPGAVSVKGFPQTLIKADKSRRNLAAKLKRKSCKHRPGSLSLLKNEMMSNHLQEKIHLIGNITAQKNGMGTRLQLTRVRRQVKLDPPKRGKSGRSGAFSVLGDPQNDGQNDRPKRSV